MMGVFKSSWTPRTGLHAARKKAAGRETTQTAEEWIYTRGIILRVLGSFPDALKAIRGALETARRACPKELYEPA